jgi:hypothetical protein
MKYKAAVKGGRCWNGNHKDRGQVVHCVPAMPDDCNGDWFYKSLCGVEPGLRSYGWSTTDKQVNCLKCLKKLEEQK